MKDVVKRKKENESHPRLKSSRSAPVIEIGLIEFAEVCEVQYMYT